MNVVWQQTEVSAITDQEVLKFKYKSVKNRRRIPVVLLSVRVAQRVTGSETYNMCSLSQQLLLLFLTNYYVKAAFSKARVSVWVLKKRDMILNERCSSGMNGQPGSARCVCWLRGRRGIHDRWQKTVTGYQLRVGAKARRAVAVYEWPSKPQFGKSDTHKFFLHIFILSISRLTLFSFLHPHAVYIFLVSYFYIWGWKSTIGG